MDESDVIRLAHEILNACTRDAYEEANYLASKLPVDLEVIISNPKRPNMCVTIQQRRLQLPAHLNRPAVRPLSESPRTATCHPSSHETSTSPRVQPDLQPTDSNITHFE